MSGEKLIELELLAIAAHDVLMTLQTRRANASSDPAMRRAGAVLARYNLTDAELEARLIGPVAGALAYLQGHS